MIGLIARGLWRWRCRLRLRHDGEVGNENQARDLDLYRSLALRSGVWQIQGLQRAWLANSSHSVEQSMHISTTYGLRE